MAEHSIEFGDLDGRIQLAVERFWGKRDEQGERQGQVSGRKDAGSRTKVTGGKHLDAFVELIAELVHENCRDIQVLTQRYVRDPATALPGYFRPTKLWDLVFIHNRQLIGCVELKSHVGPSFGNNYNNRSEEAIGTAVDIRTAYREGAFAPSPKPWIGYMMLLQEMPKSTTPVKVADRNFKVFPEFENASYAKRYEIGITRLVREGLYTSACLMLSRSEEGAAVWHEPQRELSFRRFVASLIGHGIAATSSD